ncbi:MAG: FAD-dependent oxidoreductase, partial [Desulfobaccales bacterium]
MALAKASMARSYPFISSNRPHAKKLVPGSLLLVFNKPISGRGTKKENDLSFSFGHPIFVKADAVVLALGQQTDSSFLRQVPGIEFKADDTVIVDAQLMTGHAGIFAGGDMVPGERTVTVAVGHGKRAAGNIDAWLRGVRYAEAVKAPLVSFEMLRLPVFAEVDPAAQTALGVADRISGFEEVVSGLDEREARHEA